MRKIVVNSLSREQRIAVLEEGQLEHLHLMNSHDESLVGNVYVARVDQIVPGMDAAFVNYGGSRNGFLHKEDILSSRLKPKGTPISQLVTQGEKILVQVIRDETEHKGARVTGFVEISTPYMVYTPCQNYIAVSKKMPHKQREQWKRFAEHQQVQQEGMLIRTEMGTKDEAFFMQELEACREAYKALEAKRNTAKAPSVLVKQNHLLQTLQREMKNGHGTVYIDDFALYQALQKEPSQWEFVYYRERDNIFAAMNIEQQLNRLHKRIVWLDNGGFLVIEEGEAMTTIDVNTGKFTGKAEKNQTVTETNKLAAIESMRQIKLRNISGMILIDFINSNHQEAILKTVREYVKKDAMTVQIIGFTELGILQLTRKVTSPSLGQYATTVCPTCQGAGRVESAQAAAFRLERELLQHRNGDYHSVVIELTKDVLQWFTGENQVFCKRLEKDTGLQLHFEVVEREQPYFYVKQLK
ncbi:MAG: Rne/Rng family ribonuclease [Bacillus sp. (in: firmicutes)]